MPPQLTPEAAFLALRDAPGAFWLDSGPTVGPHARFHHLGAWPSEALSLADRDPLPELERWLDAARAWVDSAVPHAVGFLSYDVARFLEPVPEQPPLPAGCLPECWFGRYDAVASFDRETGRGWLTATTELAAERLVEAFSVAPRPVTTHSLAVGPMCFQHTEAAYAAQVRRVLEYLRAGEVYQVNLSQRLDVHLAAGVRASDVYVRLRRRHPAPFGAFLALDRAAIVSNSPEAFIDVDLARHITTWPLKGTLPRTADPATLVASGKDQAEHVMIVDLERNDLGRLAVPGSVRVASLAHLVAYPTVYHLESTITAVPRPGTTLTDVLRATFPGGSITGAPKVRAMQLIAELEGERRGPYCGALGYVTHGGRCARFSIPIRTAIVSPEHLTLRVGGGIVIDSDPVAEYAETVTKARAFLDLLTVRDRGASP